MRQRLLIATGNPGKLREFAQLFASLQAGEREIRQWELVAPTDLGLTDFTVVEDGETYQQNAARKARSYANAARLPALADDSGLEVDALDGAPGLYSARYAGPQADDAANRAKLLNALSGVGTDQRGARFRCVIAIAFPFTTNVRVGEGTVEGRIGMDQRGDLGFGYDPIFELPDGRRMAELSVEEKNAVSHRRRALADVAWALRALHDTLSAGAGTNQ